MIFQATRATRAMQVLAAANNAPLLRLLIVRHGETTANKAGIIQGQSLDPSYKLTELGVAQAKAAGTTLDGRAFWKVVSSDLPRCKETAS